MNDPKNDKSLFDEVSHATFRSEDLLTAYCTRLRALHSAGYEVNMGLIEEAQDILDHDECESEDAYFLQSELFDALNNCAEESPFDIYFSAHEGDGSLFGFWEIDLEEEL